jgi:arylsulfatase A-like enzyme
VNWVRANLGDDWLIVFASDHGESLGEHNFFYDHGDYVYNASLRVPLAFVFPPGTPFNRPGYSDDRVSLMDVMPTLAELLGIPIPANLGYEIEGRSLVPHFRGESTSPPPAFAECGRSFFSKLIQRRTRFDVAGRFRTVLEGDWKLIWTPGQTPDLEFELYNVRTDPDETVNLYAPDHPQVEHLKRLLNAWVRVPTSADTAPTPEDLRLLKSLGYVGDDDD